MHQHQLSLLADAVGVSGGSPTLAVSSRRQADAELAELLQQNDSVIAQTMQRASRDAKLLWHRLKPLAGLVRAPCIVAHRYRGQLNGESGRPLTMLYVGNREHAAEFELFLGANAVRDAAPPETLFCGRLPAYVAQRKRLEELCSEADLVLREVFPFESDAAGLVYHPYVDGQLEVMPTLAQQIHRVRSRTYRRLLRELERRDDFSIEVQAGGEAVAAFWNDLHAPYVAARFGNRGAVDAVDSVIARFGDSARVLRVRQQGCVVAGALVLHDYGRRGNLGYYRNGLADFAQLSAKLMTERTGMLELALLRHAVEHTCSSIDLGFTRAIASDGRYIHKRRLGCRFEPVLGAPRLIIQCKPTHRAALYARFALVTGPTSRGALQLGFDAHTPVASSRQVRSLLKSYVAPGVREIHLHSDAPPSDKGRLAYEAMVREVAGDREVIVHAL